MKKNISNSLRARRGYTLVEVMITMTILVLTMAMCLGLFITSLKVMYKDTQRLTTNGVLRNITAQVAKETVDASEFYLFPTYQALDGSVDLTADISAADATNPTDYYGDCLVLVTRVTDTGASTNVRQWRVYYRVVTAPNQDGPIRYYESPDLGTTNTTALATLLNAVDLKTTPAYATSRLLANIARGRPRPSSSNFYPIFNSNAATFLTNVNQSVSINVEIINGGATGAENLISSSSFNYTISPRR